MNVAYKEFKSFVLKPMYARSLFFVCVLLNSVVACAQSFETKVDDLILTAFSNKSGPGAVFMVAQNGKTVYQKAVGKANLELDVNLTSENVFQLSRRFRGRTDYS